MYKSEELSYLNRMVITVYVNLSSTHDGGLDTLTAVIVDAVVVGHLRQLQRSVHLPLHAVSVHLLLPPTGIRPPSPRTIWNKVVEINLRQVI